jgi:hypothetical protein
MRVQSIVFLPLLVAGPLVLSGCGTDSSGPVTPKAVAIVAGDNQTGPGGDDLPDSLRVVVTGSDNQAMRGVTVTWAAGGADVSPLTSTTDANGATAVRLSLGPVGAVIVTATVAGLAPATFNETAVDPCTWLHTLSVGQTVTGRLHQYDCLDRAWFSDYYLLPVSGPWQTVLITMGSDSIFTALPLWDASEKLVGIESGNGPTFLSNSHIKIMATGGEYVIGAVSLFSGKSGPYVLAAAETPSSEENCEDFWLTRGVTTQQVLSTTDCAEPGSTYGDEFALVLREGEPLDVTEHTTAFDALLQLYRLRHDSNHRVLVPPDTLVASDDSVGGTHLTFTADSTGFYVLVATTMTPGGQGAYTLTLEPRRIAVDPPVAERDRHAAAAVLDGARLLVHPSLPSPWPGRRRR